ncbi:beta-glucoside-specific PTS transporter subunit IIABC [Mobilicoccus caccae]|uniref:PTS beta-glucoside transporter subunit EIIBCA n=1 Tax=Mobilicoccus caccae TaxID=1859295 RepID=A0ABQ6IP55_9MICO|nr:beta-glucoside-specific PTS transporter subunit IIABC [Mobilicoccus caccae]GMA38512.1 PTS beta-glucoside transporter subunit EIIBCA [Mobilicoccus caccae]
MSAQIRDYPKLARDILDVVGGPENVSNAARCATRLRLVLKETPPDAKARVSELPGVITVVENNGQFQVVIGNHISDVYDEFITHVAADSASSDAPHGSIVNRIIATMSAVFAPFIYVLAAAGILQGGLIIARMIQPAFETTGTHEVLAMMSWAPFTFLPIFIAITAAQHFKVNIFNAVLCTAALVTPTWAEIAGRIAEGEQVTFFGIALSQTTYTSSVLPPLFLVWILSYLERFLNRRIPAVARQLLVPLISILVMVPLTLLVIGPITAAGATLIATAYNAGVEVAPWLAAAFIGGFWQVAVIFGFHWGITPVVLDNFAKYGQDSFQAFQTAAVIGQVGAAAGVFLKSRNRKIKGVAAPATVTGVFGITEPAIYGVTLRFKTPFIFGCIAGAVGAVVISLFGARYYAYAGLPGPLTIVNAYSPDNPMSLWGELIGCAIAFFGAAALVYFAGYKDVLAETGTGPADPQATSTAGDLAQDLQIASPLEGSVVPLSEVPDPVFSGGVLGQGVAIRPTGSRIVAPFDGSVVSVLDSQHAVGLRSDEGVELLIHVGLDTVALEGEGFTGHVSAGQQVRAGDLLIEFDPHLIGERGYDLITPVVVTNAAAFAGVRPVATDSAVIGEPVLALDRLPAANSASTDA